MAEQHMSQDGNMVTYETADNFEDAAFAVENAIVGKGLVIDNVSHVGDMLERTGADVGSDVKVFEGAQVFNFCSADLSRTVMEADITNIAYCPYGIFVYAAPDAEGALIGYRTMPEGPMQEVQALLDDIAKEAAGVE
nr:DUF302 domain-containing protein [Brevirhabdus pacifica]